LDFLKGGTLARKAQYKSEKRKKELSRQKKQEMKRQKRLSKDSTGREGDLEEATGEATDESKGEEGEGESQELAEGPPL
jgi:hypothetical protein